METTGLDWLKAGLKKQTDKDNCLFFGYRQWEGNVLSTVWVWLKVEHVWGGDVLSL